MQLGNKLAVTKQALKNAVSKTKELEGNLATVSKMRTKAATNASINEEKQVKKSSKARSRLADVDDREAHATRAVPSQQVDDPPHVIPRQSARARSLAAL